MIQRQHKSVRSRLHGPGIVPQGVRFLTYLLAAAALVFWLVGPAHSHDLESLRSLQQKELDAIEAKYSEMARKAAGNPDGTVNVDSEAYRKVEQEYFQQMQKTREKYTKLDPRMQELTRIQEKYDGLIENSGSGATAADAKAEKSSAKTDASSESGKKKKDLKPPKDVRADLDLTAKTDEAARQLVDEWRKNGDYTITHDPKTGKYVSKMHDATIWEPATPERQKARQADSDAFVTPGGKKAVGVTGPEAMTDPLGYALDNKQKFQHAREVKDMKTLGKSLSKVAETVGHTSPVTRQADDLRNYKSLNEAGVTRLGESKEVQERKIKEYTNKAEADFEVAEHKARQRSERLQEARRNMADTVEKTSKSSADQNWKDQLGDEPGQSKKSKGGGSDDTAEQVRKRADALDEANAEAKKRVDGTDTKPAPGSGEKGAGEPDAPTQKADADSDAKRTTDGDADAGRKSPADVDAEVKRTADGDADAGRKSPSDADADAKRTADGDTDAGRKSSADADADVKRTADAAGEADAGRKSSTDADAPARRTADADATSGGKRAAADADGPAKPGVPSGDGFVQKGMNAADKADMIIQGIEITTTVVEGIKEGDAAKAASPLLGQDTSERARMKNAYEWAELEGKAFEAKDREVAAEIEAKLRRMGATQAEAREARNRFESGDRSGFRQNVARIKEKGVKDDGQRALDAGGPLQEEDGMKERLKEGARQTGKYVDWFYGGIVEKTEAAMEGRKQLGAIQDRTQGGIQDDVDNQVVKKMMRMGVPYDEARRAVDMRRAGDSSEFNRIAERLHREGVVDPESGTSGLDATGLTDTFEGGDIWKEVSGNAWEMVESKGRTVLKPLDMIYEWQEENNLEAMRKNERAAKVYQVLRGNGVPKDEALSAARSFAEDENSAELREVYRKYVKGRKGGKAPAAEVEVKHKNLVEFLKSLNHTKLESVFAQMGVAPSQEFLNCLCRSAGYGNPGTAQIYHPDTIGDYNPKYSCNKPGEPCVVSGFGCLRHPLPSDAGIWEGCMAAHRTNVVTGSDGKVVPDSGERLDDVMMRKIRERNAAKAAMRQ